MSFLMATSAFVLGRKCKSSPQISLLPTAYRFHAIKSKQINSKYACLSSGTAVYPHMPILCPHAVRYSTNGAPLA